MRVVAGLDANEAPRQLREEGKHAGASQSAANDHPSSFIDPVNLKH
jgi:hypothetical protein